MTATATMTRTETIQTLYAAFERRDMPGILACVTDDVDWNNERVASSDCPWNGNFSGKANLPGFFQAVGDNLDIRVFDPRTFVEAGDHVVVLLRIESIVRRNGRPLLNDAVHVWTFAGDKVKSYRHYNDTAAEADAWRG
jgi:ketosteroid isomerase-like protein